VKRAVVVLAAAALLGCQGVRPTEGPRASAQLQQTTGNSTTGSATFTQVGDKVRVVANVSGLNPGQEHAFHIHEAGDCSSGDGMSAKGHFNPYGKPHGNPATSEHHAGDMPALKADAGGNATLDTTLEVMTVKPGPASIVGRGLIVHAGPDDYTTQPTGNAGARLACGVINPV
jgi:superoxide dismutase, Cu-Zn family